MTAICYCFAVMTQRICDLGFSFLFTVVPLDLFLKNFPFKLLFILFCKEVNWDKIVTAGMTRTSSSSTPTGQSPTGWEYFFEYSDVYHVNVHINVYVIAYYIYAIFIELWAIFVIFIVLTVTSMINAISYQTLFQVEEIKVILILNQC